MSILDANGAIACAECGRQARAVRDRLKAENDKLREERDMYSDLVEMMDHPDINAQLKTENAKLREENEHLIIKLNAEHIARQNVEAENEKLRELACHMLTCIRYMESPAFDENGCSFCKYDGKRVCNFEERMKALDIEAEE